MRPSRLDRREALSWLAGRGVAGALLMAGPACAAQRGGAPGGFLDVTDFGALGDGVHNDAPALARALAEGAAVWFPPTPAHYVFASTVEATLSRDCVIDFNGQRVESRAGTVRLSAPRVPGQMRLTRPVLAGSRSIVIESPQPLQRGDLLYLTRDVRPSPEWSDIVKDCLEVASSDAAGAGISCVEGTRFSYQPGDRGLDILAYRRVSVALRRAVIAYRGADQGDVRPAITCEGFNGVEIEAPVIEGALPFVPARDQFRVGIQLYRVWNWTVSNGRYFAMTYPIGVYGGSRRGVERSAVSRFCRHGHADVGDWSSTYRLDGLVAEQCAGSISTHPSFDVSIRNSRVVAETALSNMRCIGGSLVSARINCISSPETPQYQSIILDREFQYLYDEADFQIKDVVFDNPLYTNNPEILVGFGRKVRVEGLRCFAIACGDVGSIEFGRGNWFGATRSPRPYMPALRARRVLDLSDRS